MASAASGGASGPGGDGGAGGPGGDGGATPSFVTAALPETNGDRRPRGLFSFVVFRGNNARLIQAALERRPWWHCEAPGIPTAAEQDDEDRELARVAMSNDPIALTRLQRRRRVVSVRRRAALRTAFEAQAFNFCWKPTNGVERSSDGTMVTLHTHTPGNPDAGRLAGAEPRKLQLVNHFSSMKCLTSKNGLLRSLQEFYEGLGINPFEVTPTTFVVKSMAKGEAGADEWRTFCEHFRDIASRQFQKETSMPRHHCRRNMWIVKPSYMNQGRGIEVFSELSKIKQHLTGKAGQEYLVQNYLEKPLLFNGRKFDIRCWAVVTDTWDVYVYEQGYLRTSSEPFTLDLGDKGEIHMVHLTNYCMQKHSKNLGRFEEGNTLSFAQFQRYLDTNYADAGIDFRLHIWSRIQVHIRDSILAVRDKLDLKNKGRRCMELFGYDFMVDSDFRVWLIEVNTNPYLGVQNAWHGGLLNRMVEDMVRIAIDPVFPPPTGQRPVDAPAYDPIPVPAETANDAGGDDGLDGGAGTGDPVVMVGTLVSDPEAANSHKGERNGFDMVYSENPDWELPDGFDRDPDNNLRPRLLPQQRPLEWYYPNGVPPIDPEDMAPPETAPPSTPAKGRHGGTGARSVSRSTSHGGPRRQAIRSGSKKPASPMTPIRATTLEVGTDVGVPEPPCKSPKPPMSPVARKRSSAGRRSSGRVASPISSSRADRLRATKSMYVEAKKALDAGPDDMKLPARRSAATHRRAASLGGKPVVDVHAPPATLTAAEQVAWCVDELSKVLQMRVSVAPAARGEGSEDSGPSGMRRVVSAGARASMGVGEVVMPKVATLPFGGDSKTETSTVASETPVGWATEGAALDDKEVRRARRRTVTLCASSIAKLAGEVRTGPLLARQGVLPLLWALIDARELDGPFASLGDSAASTPMATPEPPAAPELLASDPSYVTAPHGTNVPRLPAEYTARIVSEGAAAHAVSAIGCLSELFRSNPPLRGESPMPPTHKLIERTILPHTVASALRVAESEGLVERAGDDPAEKVPTPSNEESVVQLMALRCLLELGYRTHTRGGFGTNTLSSESGDTDATGVHAARSKVLRAGVLHALLLVVTSLEGEARRVALEGVGYFADRELRVVLAHCGPGTTPDGKEAPPSAAAPAFSLPRCLTSGAARAVVMTSARRELASRATKRSLRRERSVKAAEEANRARDAVAARQERAAAWLQQQEETMQRLRVKMQAKREKEAAAKREMELTAREQSQAAAARRAEEVHERWLAQKRRDRRERLVRQREQERLRAQQLAEAEARQGLAKEKMAEWIRRKAAESRLKRQEEEAERMMEAREKGTLLLARRQRLTSTLRRMHGRSSSAAAKQEAQKRELARRFGTDGNGGGHRRAPRREDLPGSGRRRTSSTASTASDARGSDADVASPAASSASDESSRVRRIRVISDDGGDDEDDGARDGARDELPAALPSTRDTGSERRWSDSHSPKSRSSGGRGSSAAERPLSGASGGVPVLPPVPMRQVVPQQAVAAQWRVVGDGGRGGGLTVA